MRLDPPGHPRGRTRPWLSAKGTRSALASKPSEVTLACCIRSTKEQRRLVVPGVFPLPMVHWCTASQLSILNVQPSVPSSVVLSAWTLLHPQAFKGHTRCVVAELFCLRKMTSHVRTCARYGVASLVHGVLTHGDDVPDFGVFVFAQATTALVSSTSSNAWKGLASEKKKAREAIPWAAATPTATGTFQHPPHQANHLRHLRHLRRRRRLLPRLQRA